MPPDSEPEPARSFRIWPTVLTLIFLALLWQQLHDYFTADLVIEPVSVSTGLERAGVSSIALTHKLADHLSALIGSTNDILGSCAAMPN
jgi:hypothetical protein